MAKLIVLTGPPGAGKSSTSSKFLETIDGVWGHISQDNMRDLIKAGFVSANGHRSEWSYEIKRQWEVGILISCDIAKRYLEAGINCILEISANPEDFAVWKDQLGNFEYELIVLLPTEETVLQRNNERTGTAKLMDSKISEEFKTFVAWSNNPGTKIIHNSNLSVETTTQKIQKLLK